MKFRTGFVSNSSTSSFVAIIAKEAHEQAFQSLPQLYQELLREIGFTEYLFCGVQCISVHGYICDEGASINGQEVEQAEGWDWDADEVTTNKRFFDEEGEPLAHNGEILEGGRHLVNEYEAAIEQLPETKRHIGGKL